MTSDPGDSYNAHQKARQVYVVLRLDDGEGDVTTRITVVKILRRHEEAQREVAERNKSGTGRHFWQVGWLAPDES